LFISVVCHAVNHLQLIFSVLILVSFVNSQTIHKLLILKTRTRSILPSRWQQR